MRELPPHLMRDAEADYLVELAAGKVVLEIGCFRGRTTARMALAAQRVWTVDNHHAADLGYPYDSMHDYFAHLDDNGVRDQVVSIVGDFANVLLYLPIRFYDLVIVDGAHDSRSVHHDLTCSTHLVKRPGIIAMHDWDLVAVRTVGSHVLGQPSQMVDRLAIFRGGF